MKVTDPPLRVLISETWALLRTHPGLWTPPLLLNLMVALLAANGGHGAAVFLPMACAWLLTIAFRAGWLEQMVRVVRQRGEKEIQRPTWGQFLEGVGHYFWRFLGGEIAQVLVLGAALLVVLAIGGQSIGWPTEAMLKELMAAANQSGPALVKMAPATVLKLNAWTVLLAGWAGFWGVVAFLLLFWQTLCVWQDEAWPRAWLGSLRTVGRHFRIVFPLVLFQAITYLLVFQLLATGSGLLMMLGYGGYVLAWTYFTLILFTAVQRWEPHAAATPEHS